MSGLGIVSAGMVTAVGLDRASSCAAMRGGLDGFRETGFVGFDGDPLVGAHVPLPRAWIGERRLAHLAAGAVVDALAGRDVAGRDLVLILCLPEADRPGRPVRDAGRLAARLLEFSGLPETTRVHAIAQGRPSGIVALRQAAEALARGAAAHVLIVGVDSYLTTVSVSHYMAAARLLGPDNANGFIPGEAAAAVLCGPDGPGRLALAGIGTAREEAYLYNPEDRPLRADGMAAAYRAALAEAGMRLEEVDYRISDVTGEIYFFRQSALALMRVLRGHAEIQDFWSPAESLGNTGAAVVPLMVGQALTAWQKDYAAGDPVLVEASGDDGACGAAVFTGRRAAAARAA